MGPANKNHKTGRKSLHATRGQKTWLHQSNATCALTIWLWLASVSTPSAAADPLTPSQRMKAEALMMPFCRTALTVSERQQTVQGLDTVDCW